MAGLTNFSRGLGSASTGIGQAVAALAGGPQAFQAGYDAELSAQSKLAQALAQVRQADSAARLHDAQALEASAKTDVLRRRPGIADLAVASASGVDVPTLNAYRERQTTGQAPAVPMGPPAEDGSMGMGRAQFDPATSSRIAQQLVRLAPILNNEKDLKPDDYAKAAGLYQDQDQEAAVAGGTMSPMALATLRYAAKGSAPYHFDSTGFVGNNITGALDTTNPGAQSTIELRGAQASQASAAAGASSAHAGLFRAQTDEVKNGPKLKFDPERGVLVDERGGTARAVIGPDGKPLSGKDKPLNEGQSKALLFGARMAAADEVLSGLSGKFSPGVVAGKLAVEQLPLVGGISGASLNAVMSPQNQMAEQAQRDFINAVLRRESGAAIAPSEFSNAQKQYFPQPGDGPDVLRQKAANRQSAITAFKTEVGPVGVTEFERIVKESRAARADAGRPGPAPANTGGASGGWGDGWSIERVK